MHQGLESRLEPHFSATCCCPAVPAVPAVVATAAAAGVGGVGMVWWCGDDSGAQTTV